MPGLLRLLLKRKREREPEMEEGEPGAVAHKRIAVRSVFRKAVESGESTAIDQNASEVKPIRGQTERGTSRNLLRSKTHRLLLKTSLISRFCRFSVVEQLRMIVGVSSAGHPKVVLV